jgi:hypothetical protein
METKDDSGQVNPVSPEALWIEEKLLRYVKAGLGLLAWAFFVAEVMAEGKYHSTYPFFAVVGIAILLALAGLATKRYRRQCLFATFSVHLILLVPCLYPQTEWAGGDDASSMAWFWLLGGACLVDLGVTIRNWIVLSRRKSFKLVAKRRPR